MRVSGLFVLAVAAALGLAAAACARARPALSDAEKLQKIEAMYAGYHEKSFPDVPDITVDELLAERQQVVLVDVRSPKERAVSIIPGAITPEELEARAARDRGRRVVAYCTIGYRSGLYVERLRREGWDAYNLAGSILAWTHAHQPLVDPQGEPTHRVDVYGRKWNLAASGYDAVW